MLIQPVRTEYEGAVAVMTDPSSDEELRWNMRFVEKTSAVGRRLGEGDDDDFIPVIERLFEELNLFIRQGLTNEERVELFKLYKEIKPFVSPQTRYELQERLVRLYQILDLRRIYDWVVNYSQIRPSKTINKLYVPGASPHPRDRTYIEVDYLWLASLAIALRAMLPIWGEWFKYPDQSNNLKERQAFMLLGRTSLMTAGPNPHDPATLDIYPPMQKLEMFVSGSIQIKDIKQSAIIVGGLTTEELPDWMLALTIVRRVSVGELRNDFNNQKRNVCLVASIYKFVDNRIKQLDKNFGGKIIEKEISESASQDENNLSRIESFREHDRTPADAIEKTRAFLMRPEAAIKELSKYSAEHPGVYDRDLYFEILEKCKTVFSGRDIEPVQEQIMQWMSSFFMSPRMLDHMDYEQYVVLMAAVTTFLIEHNHREVAAIVSGVPVINSDMFVTGAPSASNRLETGLAQRLRNLYRYSSPETAKRNGSTDGRLGIDECLNGASNKIKEHTWEINIPERYCNFVTKGRRYIPNDIKTILAKLAVAIAERKF